MYSDNIFIYQIGKDKKVSEVYVLWSRLWKIGTRFMLQPKTTKKWAKYSNNFQDTEHQVKKGSDP